MRRGRKKGHEFSLQALFCSFSLANFIRFVDALIERKGNARYENESTIHPHLGHRSVMVLSEAKEGEGFIAGAFHGLPPIPPTDATHGHQFRVGGRGPVLACPRSHDSLGIGP